MRFSREQMNQIAKTNGYSIEKLISNQRRLSELSIKKKSIQDRMKKILSSSTDVLPGESSLIMGTINIKLLKSLGYASISDLINEFEDNSNSISDIQKSVSEEDKKIQSSLDKLKEIDVTQEMKDQVTQEVLLDSDLADVKNNSQEILLMLSQSKSGSEVIKTALEHTKKNEERLIQYIKAGELADANRLSANNSNIDKLNNQSDNVAKELQNLAKPKEDQTWLDHMNTKISKLSKGQKNGILAVTFFTFLGLGIKSGGGKTPNPKKDDKKGDVDEKNSAI